MKTLELSEMESISGGGFWEGFYGAANIVGGIGSLAAYAGLVTISGPVGIVGLAVIGVGCGIAAFN